MSNNALKSDRFLAVVYWYGAMIWAHGSDDEQAAKACAKNAKRSLRQYLKRGERLDWVVNLYEIDGGDWSYCEDAGICWSNGTRIKRFDVRKVKA